jgi:hypothetical protein
MLASMMIPHHNQAIKMSALVLAKATTRTGDSRPFVWAANATTDNPGGDLALAVDDNSCRNHRGWNRVAELRSRAEGHPPHVPG